MSGEWGARDGVVGIREATGRDVEGVMRYMRELVDEEGLYIGYEPGEYDPPVERELGWIEEHMVRDNSVMFLAVASGEKGEIVGLLNCTGSRRWANRHETTLGISVRKGWRGKGIGTRLMKAALEWAEGNEVVKRVQLEVLAENVEAIELYERLGFEVEGVRRRAMWKQGRWMDGVVMAKVWDTPTAPGSATLAPR